MLRVARRHPTSASQRISSSETQSRGSHVQMLRATSPRQGGQVSLPAVLRRMDSSAAVQLEQERSTHGSSALGGGTANGEDGAVKAVGVMSSGEIDLLIHHLSEVRTSFPSGCCHSTDLFHVAAAMCRRHRVQRAFSQAISLEACFSVERLQAVRSCLFLKRDLASAACRTTSSSLARSTSCGASRTPTLSATSAAA